MASIHALPAFRLVFTGELEPCSCSDCNRVALANHGARQWRMTIVPEFERAPGPGPPDLDAPAVAAAGASTPSNQHQPENVHVL